MPFDLCNNAERNNQIEAQIEVQTEALATVSTPFRKNSKDFQAADDVFNHEPIL